MISKIKKMLKVDGHMGQLFNVVIIVSFLWILFRKYSRNGFEDWLDFLGPIVIIILFLDDLYQEKKKVRSNID